MGKKIEFVQNYSDLSTNQGFQFEFYCNRCRSGYRTRFKPSLTGKVSEVLDAANSILGGIFGRAADIGDRIHSSSWEKAQDEAFEDALNELKSDFVQCPRCSSWVCRSNCWNTKRGLCKGCAPDLGVEMSAAQASRSVEEVWAHARMSDEDRKLGAKNWEETIRATCPQCEKPLASNAKFCPECGFQLVQKKFCSQCGATNTTGAKFCAECGEKMV